jgi:Zn-dependent protease with chaperone function
MYPATARLAFWTTATITALALAAFFISMPLHQQHMGSSAAMIAILFGLPLRPAYRYVADPIGIAFEVEKIDFKEDSTLLAAVQPLLNGIDSNVRVGYYESPVANALAVSSVFGKQSVIAFSTTLLNALAPNQFMAIAAHEVAHIKNADSKNKSYIIAFHQLVNFYPAHIAHHSKKIIASVSGLILFIVAVLLLLTIKTYDIAGILAGIKIVLPFLVPLVALLAAIYGPYLLNKITDLLFLHYSRQREFVADADGAAMTSNADMKEALQLISNGESSKISFFDSHPPTSERLSRL